MTPATESRRVRWTDLLLPLTPLYAVAVRTRAAAYERGLCLRRRLPVPVVSVGNLVLGGAGKTPTTVALVRDLIRRGRRPAVLTRGWGRTTADPLVLVGPDPGYRPQQAGDEPLELALRLPGVPVVVDGDRRRGGEEAIRRGADVLLLDDGFQHLGLARDLDLVVVDAGDPWGGGRLPPRGRLREPLSALGRASAVLVTKVPSPHQEAVAAIAKEVHRHAPGLPVLAARLEAVRMRTPDGVESIGTLAGGKVLAFAGVGRPAGFFQLLEEAGAEVVARRSFPDHHLYTAAEVDELTQTAAAAGARLVTTGKDAVKLPPRAPVWVVEVEMVAVTGSWERLWSLLDEARA